MKIGHSFTCNAANMNISSSVQSISSFSKCHFACSYNWLIRTRSYFGFKSKNVKYLKRRHNVSNSRIPCSIMDNDESSQPTFMRARSTNDFGRTNRERTSGLGARGLAAKFSVKSPMLEDESLNVVWWPFVLCFHVYTKGMQNEIFLQFEARKRLTPVGELIGVPWIFRWGVWCWTGVHENGPFGGVSKLPLLPLKLFEWVGIKEFVSGAKWMYSLPLPCPFCSVIGNFRFGNSEKLRFRWAASSGLHSDNSSACRMPKSLHRFTTAPNVLME